MDLYAELVQRALYPLWEGTIRGRPTLDLLRHLERTQYRSLEEIEALQLGALRRLLRHSYDHVPFYRDRLRAAGLAPEDVRSLSDLRALPILDRAEVRSAGNTRASTSAPLPEHRQDDERLVGRAAQDRLRPRLGELAPGDEASRLRVGGSPHRRRHGALLGRVLRFREASRGRRSRPIAGSGRSAGSTATCAPRATSPRWWPSSVARLRRCSWRSRRPRPISRAS